MDIADILGSFGLRPDGVTDLSRLRLSPEGVLARRNFIGGSDAPTIRDGNVDEVEKLRQIKRGEREADDLSDLLYVLIGTWTEPLNLALLEKRLEVTVSRRGERVFARRRPWMAASLDGWVADYNGRGSRVVQCKHTSSFMTRGAILEKYMPQLQHEMIVTGADAALFSVIYGTRQHEVIEVLPDYAYQAELIELEEAFWASVRAEGRAPPPQKAKERAPEGRAVRAGEISMEESNAWADAAARFLANLRPAKDYAAAVKDLKEAMPEGAKRAYGHGVEVVASKSGSLTPREIAPEKEAA